MVDGAINGELFAAYVRQQLVPASRPGDVVVMDNLACHKRAGVREAIERAGCRLLYLPPYSPDYNPIEKDQPDSTSSDGWCAAADAGYHRPRSAA